MLYVGMEFERSCFELGMTVLQSSGPQDCGSSLTPEAKIQIHHICTRSHMLRTRSDAIGRLLSCSTIFSFPVLLLSPLRRARRAENR